MSTHTDNLHALVLSAQTMRLQYPIEITAYIVKKNLAVNDNIRQLADPKQQISQKIILICSCLYFVVRVRCRRKNFTFAISSADEFLVSNQK